MGVPKTRLLTNHPSHGWPWLSIETTPRVRAGNSSFWDTSIYPCWETGIFRIFIAMLFGFHGMGWPVQPVPKNVALDSLDPGPTYEQWLQNSSCLMISSGASFLTYIHFISLGWSQSMNWESDSWPTRMKWNAVLNAAYMMGHWSKNCEFFWPKWWKADTSISQTWVLTLKMGLD